LKSTRSQGTSDGSAIAKIITCVDRSEASVGYATRMGAAEQVD